MLTTLIRVCGRISEGSAGRQVLPLHLISLPQSGRVEDHKNTINFTRTTPYVLVSLKRA